MWLISRDDWELDDTIILSRAGVALTRCIYVYSYSCSRFPSAGMSLRKRSCRLVGNCRERWWLLIQNCDIRVVSVTKDLYAGTLNKWLLIAAPGREFRLTQVKKSRGKFGDDGINKQVPRREIILNSTPTSQIWRTRTESTVKVKFPESDLYPYTRTHSFDHTLCVTTLVSLPCRSGVSFPIQTPFQRRRKKPW